MKRIKFLFFVAVLVGFAALAYAGFDESMAAYDRGDYAKDGQWTWLQGSPSPLHVVVWPVHSSKTNREDHNGFRQSKQAYFYQ